MFVPVLDRCHAAGHVEDSPDDGTFYGEIPGFDGARATAAILDAIRDKLEAVLEEWMPYHLWAHLPLPEADGLRIEFKESL